MPAGSLEDALPRLPPDSRLLRRIARDIALCVQAVHKAGYVHRDLKPANILLTSANPTWDQAAPTVNLADFGLAAKVRAAPTLICSDPAYCDPSLNAGAEVSTAED